MQLDPSGWRHEMHREGTTPANPGFHIRLGPVHDMAGALYSIWIMFDSFEAITNLQEQVHGLLEEAKRAYKQLPHPNDHLN